MRTILYYISIIWFLDPCWLIAIGLIFTCSSLLICSPSTLISTSTSPIYLHFLLVFNLPYPNYSPLHLLTIKEYSLYFCPLKQNWSSPFPFIFLVFVKNLEIEVVILELIEIELTIKIAIVGCCWEKLSLIA